MGLAERGAEDCGLGAVRIAPTAVFNLSYVELAEVEKGSVSLLGVRDGWNVSYFQVRVLSLRTGESVGSIVLR